jgi:hypothetical protein
MCDDQALNPNTCQARTPSTCIYSEMNVRRMHRAEGRDREEKEEETRGGGRPSDIQSNIFWHTTQAKRRTFRDPVVIDPDQVL